MLIYGDKYMYIEIPNENFGTENEYPDNNSGFDKNTEKMKQYNTIDLSFLRDCEYKNDICNMLSEYIHGSAVWFKIMKNKITIDDEIMVKEF